jgi:hypothetical protein
MMMRRRSAAHAATGPVSRPAPQPVPDEGTWPERIYVLTGGRGGPSGRTRLDLVTLVVAVGRRWQDRPEQPSSPRQRGLFPEHLAIIGLCQCPLSAAELSAHLHLPFSATAVLIEDLLTAGLVRTRVVVRCAIPDPELIEEVLRGLQRL